jgi:hypothetical protein
MLVIVGILITLTLMVLASRLRASGELRAAPHGWMSHQWLAEHRASHGP